MDDFLLIFGTDTCNFLHESLKSAIHVIHTQKSTMVISYSKKNACDEFDHWIAYSRDYHYYGLNYGVIGFLAPYGVFWLHLRDLLFIVSQKVGSDEHKWVRRLGLGSKNLGGSVYL